LKIKSRKVGSDIPQDKTRLAWRTVRIYTTAITDLYQEQKALGMNSHPSPREHNVKEYLKSLQRRDAQQDREQFADKGRDTLLDGYTEDEFEAVCSALWTHGASSPECHFRTLVDILLGHYMLTRGGDRRNAEISDLFTFEFKDEGPTQCIPLIFTTRAGKQNQFGHLETIGALRNRKPLICMLSGLAFYLLCRWDLGDEPFPDFSRRSLWYEIRLIKNSTGTGNPKAAFSYNSQRDWVAKAFQYVGIFSQKKTHIGRSAGAKMAELKGISEDQIRRAGRWNQEQMIGCYLNSLPRKFMRVMAGHPSHMGCFEISRANVTPPDELLSMIWPKLDTWKDRFGPRAGQIKDLAAAGLTNLLLYLREVILQDSVALRQMFPENPIWNHPVFHHAAYAAFVKEIESCQDPGAPPNKLSMFYQAMPQLADHLTAIDVKIEQRTKKLEALIDDMVKSQTTQSLQLQLLTSGGLTFRLEAPQPPFQLSTSTYASAQASITATPCSAPSRSRSRSRSRSPSLSMKPPRYRMCRTVKTVEALWREWTVGLQGNPSIEVLDRKWGNQWRAGRQSELQWYSLRLEVIKEIRHTAHTQRIGEEAAMWQVNLQQQNMRCSLDQLCKRLRASRKARTRSA
jgi:hypothetical protein